MEGNVGLENRRLKYSQSGVARTLPGLHKDWLYQRNWICYQSPPVGRDLSVVGAKEAWIERSCFLLDDLEFLLSMEYHRFWSQVCFDTTLNSFLGRLLRLLPRRHDKFSPHSDADIRGILSDTLRKAFFVFLRLSTNKESESDFMSPEFYGKIIYDHFVFDIPRLFDIAVLFHTGNPTLIEKMLSNIFKCQPSYESDLKKSLYCIADNLKTIGRNFDSFIPITKSLDSKTEERLVDVMSYCTDVVISLHSLLKAFNKAASFYREAEIDMHLAHLYHLALVPLEKSVCKSHRTGILSDETKDFFISRILLTKHSTLCVFRLMVATTTVNLVMEDKHKSHLGDDYLQMVSNTMSMSTFFQDYNKIFPLREDLDVFHQTGVEIDKTRMEYLLGGLGSSPKKQEHVTTGVTNEQQPSETTKEAEKLSMDQVQIDSLISQVRDLFPDLGDGYVEKCLTYYDWLPERVINALLEDNLPPHLSEVDRSLKREVAVPAPTNDVDVAAVYEDDEWIDDVASAHKGKKKTFKNANALLNDKTEIRELKGRYASLSLVADFDYDYDDEYDDTYDDRIMGEKEPDNDELLERRPFVVPRALMEKGEPESNSDDQEEEEISDARDNRLDFARNPEEVRAEQERKRNLKTSHRSQQPPPQNRDVVGKPKGQGQDSAVIRNRARKTQNKGKHHRIMADKKISKGMFH